MKNKDVTINMVAEKANVSKSTISRYINGKYEYMSKDTKLRIKNVIEELNYRPNIVAQNLKSKKSNLIGVVVSDISNPFSSILLQGIVDYSTNKGYQVIVSTTDNKIDKEQKYINSMLGRKVDGIIVNTTGGNDEFLKELIKKDIFITLADRTIKDLALDTVTTNNKTMTSKVIKFLYKSGYDNVAFFSNLIYKNDTRLIRYNSFIEESKKYIKNPDDLIYIIDNNKINKLEKALLDFLNKNKNKKNAIFTVNGVVMLSLLNVAKKLNIKIPNDLGVCGYDDWDWCNLVGSGLSVVAQPSYDVGSKSAELLIDRIKKGIHYSLYSPPVYIELESQLILRDSTNI